MHYRLAEFSFNTSEKTFFHEIGTCMRVSTTRNYYFDYSALSYELDHASFSKTVAQFSELSFMLQRFLRRQKA